MVVEGPLGSSFELERGVTFKYNDPAESLKSRTGLVVKGGVELILGGIIGYQDITYGQINGKGPFPTLTVLANTLSDSSAIPSEIPVPSDGTSGGFLNLNKFYFDLGIRAISGTVNIKPSPTTRPVADGYYRYIYGDSYDATSFKPSIQSGVQFVKPEGKVPVVFTSEFGGGVTDRSVIKISPPSPDIVTIYGDIEEKFVVESGRTETISGADFNGSSQESEDGSAGALEVKGDATAILDGSNTFENNKGGEGGAGAIGIADGGVLRIHLKNSSDSIVFDGNSIKDGQSTLANDVKNLGTIEIDGRGEAKFLSGGGIVGSDGVLTVLESVRLNIGLATIDQKTMDFGGDTRLILAVESFDTSIDDAEGSRTTRGGLGGMLSVQSGGTLTGSPKLEINLQEGLKTVLIGLETNEFKEYKYIYSDGNHSNFIPKLVEGLRVLKSTGESNQVISTWFRTDFVENTVGDRDGESELTSTRNYGILQLKKVDIDEDVKNTVNSALAGASESKRENMTVFLSSLIEENDEVVDAIGSGDGAALKNIFDQYNPDSHIASQLKIITVSLQSLGDVIADRMFLTSDSLSRPTAGLLVATADDKLSYGLLKEEISEKDLLSRIWLQAFGSIGTQKLEENLKNKGFGFILGYDYRLMESLKLGLAYSLSKNISKGDSREKTIVLNGVSIYGDYRPRGFSQGGPHFSTIFTYGYMDSKDNKLSGKGNVLYLAPTLGYRFDLRGSALTPEISLRYFRISESKQESTINKVTIPARDMITLAPAIRANVLIQNKYEVTAKLGVGYDVYSKGNEFYAVTMHNGQSYQLLDESGKKSKITTEAGMGLSYKMSDATKISLGYSGRYSSDLTNNSLGLEVSFRF
jgi:opacity protein-like surface antigen